MSRTTIILRWSNPYCCVEQPLFVFFFLSIHWCLPFPKGPSCETPSSSDRIFILSHTSRSLIRSHRWLNLHNCFSFVCFRKWHRRQLAVKRLILSQLKWCTIACRGALVTSRRTLRERAPVPTWSSSWSTTRRVKTAKASSGTGLSFSGSCSQTAAASFRRVA